MNIRLSLVAVALVMGAGICYAQPPYPGNDSDEGVAHAGDFIDTYTGNLSFQTRDLAVAGAVGQRGLTWGRIASSRTSQNEQLFGLGHNWVHNWQWEMLDAGIDSKGRKVLSVRLPGGWVHRFTQTSSSEWWPEPSCTYRLVSSGDSFVVQHAGGGETRFTRSQASQGFVYNLTELIDAIGNVTQIEWLDGRISQIREPAGRWLKISYVKLKAPDAPKNAKPYTVVASVTSSDKQTVTYKYTFLAGTDYPALTSVDYPDSVVSNYEYVSPKSGVRLLLSKVTDPHAESTVRGRMFKYRTESSTAVGQIDQVVASDGSNAVLNALTVDGKGSRSYAIRMENGSTVYRKYGAGGITAEQVNAFGYVKKRVYDANGRGFEMAVTDELGKVTRYERDANGQVVKQIASDGTSRSWKRDAKGRVLAETNELGLTRTFIRDEQGRVTKLQEPDGRVTETTYNSKGQPIASKDANGAVTARTYDSRGLRTKVTNALGHSVTMSYDERDRVSSVTDMRDNTTRYERDAAGRATKVIHADGSHTEVDYDVFGQLEKTVDAVGSARIFAYDTFGRLASVSDSLGHEMQVAYAALGQGAFSKPNLTVTPEGRISTTTYDAAGRVSARTTAAGTRQAATTRYAYDVCGRQASVTNPRNQTVQLFYDDRSHCVKTMNALNNATTRVFDAAGHKLSETDAKGNTTQWTYDAAGRELTKTDAKGQTIIRSYDTAGRLATLKDPKGSTYCFEYDLLGRLTTMVFPDGSRETTTYDAGGNKLTFTNRAGSTQSFTYDARNREILSEWNDGSQCITKSYDAAGRMTQEDNGVSKLSYVFDSVGRLVSETQDLTPIAAGGLADPSPRTVSYTYTADNQRESLVYPDASFVKYTYNERGQLQNIMGDGVPPPIASYEYDSAGNATQMPRENDTETTLVYDAANRVTTIAETVRRSPLSELDYTYDEVDNRISTAERIDAGVHGRVEKRDIYHYDETRQVTGADYGAKVTRDGLTPGGSQRFTYDAVGNRITVGENGIITRFSANSLNEYTQVGSFTPSYDRNGNLAAMKEWLYRFDALNRLVEATNGQMTARFWYDAKNRCVARTYNGVATLNYYDNWNLIEERDIRGDEVARYVHGRKLDEIVVMVNQYGVFYPHHDVLGNVTMLTGVDGKLTERYSYSVTGAVTITDARGSEIPSSAVGNRWFFTGREWLSGVGLYDYRNRVYSSELGRFMQTDPIKFYAGDINIYRYVGNNYVNINDPDGLDWFHDPSDPNYDLGRPDSLIPEGGAVSRFLENYVPGMSTFADNHDALVDAMHADGIPDFLCNIPTMPFMYALSIWEEAVNSVVDFFTWLFE